MDVKRNVKEALARLQITRLRRHQQKPINSILDGHDTFVLAPTSSGKSVIYQIPAIMREENPTFVIEPTISLMHDQVHKLKALGITAEYLDSTMKKKEQLEVLNQFADGKVNILYLTPERLDLESFYMHCSKYSCIWWSLMKRIVCCYTAARTIAPIRSSYAMRKLEATKSMHRSNIRCHERILR